MNRNFKNNLIIAVLSTSLSASAALVPVMSSIAKAFPDWVDWIQLLLTVPPLMIMFSSMLVSPLLKKFSDKGITVFGLILILFSGVYPYFFRSFPLLLLSRLIMGFGLGLVTTISSSLPAGYFKEGETRNKATGIQAAFSSFGSVVFSFLSGYIASIYWEGVFLVQLLNLVPLIFVLALMKKNQSFEVEDTALEKMVVSDETFVKEGALLTLLSFICIVITVTFPLNLSIYVNSKGLGTDNLTGIIVSINSMMGFLIGLSYSKISSLFKEKTLPLSLFLVGLSFFLGVKAESARVFLIASTMFGMGTSIIYPSFNNHIGEIVDEKIVAVVGMYTLATNVAQFVSPFFINKLSKMLFERE